MSASSSPNSTTSPSPSIRVTPTSTPTIKRHQVDPLHRADRHDYCHSFRILAFTDDRESLRVRRSRITRDSFGTSTRGNRNVRLMLFLILILTLSIVQTFKPTQQIVEQRTRRHQAALELQTFRTRHGIQRTQVQHTIRHSHSPRRCDRTIRESTPTYHRTR